MSSTGFASKLCVLCETRTSSRAGEHVWPKWLLTDKRLFGDGPFTTYIKDKPTLKRAPSDGSPRAIRYQTSLMGTHVPMCKVCNGVLNTRFEVPAKNLVRNLIPRGIDHIWPTLTANEVKCLALWLLKVGLLLKHPDARHDDPDQEKLAKRWSSVPNALLSWMIDGGEPTDGLSLFMARRDESLPKPVRRRIPIPTVHVGKEQIQFLTASFGLRGIDFDLVFHPGWALRHALVDEGSAVRIWPDPKGIDFATITPVHPSSMGYVVGWDVTFRAEAFASPDLPPLSCDTGFDTLMSSGLVTSVSLRRPVQTRRL